MFSFPGRFSLIWSKLFFVIIQYALQIYIGSAPFLIIIDELVSEAKLQLYYCERSSSQCCQMLWGSLRASSRIDWCFNWKHWDSIMQAITDPRWQCIFVQWKSVHDWQNLSFLHMQVCQLTTVKTHEKIICHFTCIFRRGIVLAITNDWELWIKTTTK